MHFAEVRVLTCGVEGEGERCSCIIKRAIERAIGHRGRTFADAGYGVTSRFPGGDGVTDAFVLTRPCNGVADGYVE